MIYGQGMLGNLPFNVGPYWSTFCGNVVSFAYKLCISCIYDVMKLNMLQMADSLIIAVTCMGAMIKWTDYVIEAHVKI